MRAINSRAKTKKCKKCKSTIEEGARYGTFALDKDGLCVWCAPPASTCSEGEKCDYERVHDWRPEEADTLNRLTLCAVHDKLRKRKLREAREAAKDAKNRQRPWPTVEGSPA